MIGRRVEDCPGRELGKFVKPSCTAVPRGVRPPPDHYSDRGAKRHYLSFFDVVKSHVCPPRVAHDVCGSSSHLFGIRVPWHLFSNVTQENSQVTPAIVIDRYRAY